MLKWLGGIVGAFAALLVLLFVGARFSDGPLAVIPGGPLESGALVEGLVTDWGFAASTEEIEMQLVGDSTSRTTWIIVHEGQAFIPCSLGFPPGKTWHERAVVDGGALLRIAGERYPVTLTRVEEGPLQEAVSSAGKAKYGGGPPGDGTWFFQIASRAP